MEPVTIAVVSAVVFGVVASISAFIRNLMLSRDKALNAKAQSRALNQEARELEHLRTQMEGVKRFTSHYEVLGTNIETIRYLDDKIDELIAKKRALIFRYTELVAKESAQIMTKGPHAERFNLCDLLRQEMDAELKHYNSEIASLQQRRSALWDSHAKLEKELISSERARNDTLDQVYLSHSGILGKVYHRHDDTAQLIARDNISASSESYKLSVMGPLKLAEYFKPMSGVASGVLGQEMERRKAVQGVERSINTEDDMGIAAHGHGEGKKASPSTLKPAAGTGRVNLVIDLK